MTLLHYIVELADHDNPSLLDFTSELADVREAARLNFEALGIELRNWTQRVGQMKCQLTAANDDQLNSLMKDFIASSWDNLQSLQQLSDDIVMAANKLAHHFCEDPTKMKLNEALSIFSVLLDKIAAAKRENEARKKQEERAARLAAQRAAAQTESAQASGASAASRKMAARKPPEQEEVCVVDRLLADIRRGDFKLRKAG